MYKRLNESERNRPEISINGWEREREREEERRMWKKEIRRETRERYKNKRDYGGMKIHQTRRERKDSK